MIYPKKMTTFCPKCKTHTPHTLKLLKSGRMSEMTEHNRKYARILKGFGGKRKGVKPRRKARKNIGILLTCTKCERKRPIEGHKTKKALEVSK